MTRKSISLSPIVQGQKTNVKLRSQQRGLREYRKIDDRVPAKRIVTFQCVYNVIDLAPFNTSLVQQQCLSPLLVSVNNENSRVEKMSTLHMHINLINVLTADGGFSFKQTIWRCFLCGVLPPPSPEGSQRVWGPSKSENRVKKKRVEGISVSTTQNNWQQAGKAMRERRVCAGKKV
jgi:hypothetical protein